MSTTPSYSRSVEARCAGQTDVCMYVCMFVEMALLRYTITAMLRLRLGLGKGYGRGCIL